MSRAALIAANPAMFSMFQVFAPFVSAREKNPHSCSYATNPIDLAADLRDQLRGSHIAVIGIDGDDAEVARAARTLAHAVRSHLCAIVITDEGWCHFSDWFAGLSPRDQKFLTVRVAAAILVGKVEPTSFVGFYGLFNATEVETVGGLGWAPSSCSKMASFIKQAAVHGLA